MERDENNNYVTQVLHWNYRGFVEFPIDLLNGKNDSKIKDIYMKENQLSRLPHDIGKLNYLESLYLSGNDITFIPKEISRLKCLKCLDLSGNLLRELPEDIGDVSGLRYLILDDNLLTELPLRIAELRKLRYLSVCDNKLTWLPQKPVYNYYHSEFRFWRNSSIETLPYSLWFHMFREKKIRSLNIGCLGISCPPSGNTVAKNVRKKGFKLKTKPTEWKIESQLPPTYRNIQTLKCPSLLELCKRRLYNILCRVRHLDPIQCSYSEKSCDYECVTMADLVEEIFGYIPKHIKQEFSRGPVVRCENIGCRIPTFDYVFIEFCLRDIYLFEEVQKVILCAVFCSRQCASVWKKNKADVIEYELEDSAPI